MGKVEKNERVGLIDLLNNTYFLGICAILINGIVTGFAVYIGSHTGQRMIDKFKKNDNQMEDKQTNEIKTALEELGKEKIK